MFSCFCCVLFHPSAPLISRHFVGEFPGYQAYTTPVFFKDDWLNEYYDHKHQEQQQQQQEQQQKQQQQQQPAAAGNSAAETTTATADNSHAAIPTCHTDTASASSSSVVTCDYRFVYMGPAGSWTPVHSGGCVFGWEDAAAGLRHTHAAANMLAPQADLCGWICVVQTVALLQALNIPRTCCCCCVTVHTPQMF